MATLLQEDYSIPLFYCKVKLLMSFTIIAVYHILKDGVPFKDLGANYYNQFNREKKANALIKKIASLGYKVNVTAITDTVA